MSNFEKFIVPSWIQMSTEMRPNAVTADEPRPLGRLGF